MKPRISCKSEAIVLRSIDYGESDRIVTFYTADFGKVKGIAKGAKRSSKRFANTLESFSRLQLLFSLRNYDGLALIEEGKVINHYLGIRGDLKKTLFVSYILDITDQFTIEHRKNEALFRLVRDFLELMDSANASEDLIRVFEMRLLRLAGYEPVLDRCVACKAPVRNGDVYHFSVREGGVKCGSCSPRNFEPVPMSTGTIKSMLLGKDMEKEMLCRLVLTEQSARESRHFLERFIAHLLDKELKSLHVIREIHALGI